jgi:5-methylcytosine-specific restriction protein A
MLNTKRAREFSTITHRTRGRRLMEENAAILAEQPLCVSCQAKGKVAAAIEVDHIIPLWRGGPDERNNKQGLCIPCHQAKTKRERSNRIAPHESWGGGDS